jgi:hypothetical protein
MSSNQRPDTLMQDRITQIDEIFLHRTAGPYRWVKSGKAQIEQMLSALPAIADIGRAFLNVRVVPKPALSRCSKTHVYLITSSARASTVGGTVRPNAFAVARLMTSSNLVGCSTGRSAGLAPRRILSTNSAARRNWSGKFGP